MKTSGVAARSSVQNTEDCGVWLDTVQMKGKALKKRSARPISKLLNPFADGAGYNVAVALNFTQTKLEMPKTKQSSISKFFSGQRRVLNKMSTSVGPNEGPPKAIRESKSDCKKESLQSYADYNQINTQWRKEDNECNFTSLPNIDTCDFKEESFMDVSQIINKDDLPLNNCDITQESSYCNPEPSFTGSFVPQNGFKTFGGLFNNEENSSTQKTSDGLPLQIDKENMAPISNTHVQLPKRMLRSPTKLDQDLDSFKWIKPKSSPIKHANCRFRDSDESLSTLFTQDSQGFRVIAHRGLQPLSPLKDQSNISLSASCRPEEDEDEEILFTQDSQGNLVMKHEHLD
ncbi:unnamed protein product [Knipowitschia caucasica]